MNSQKWRSKLDAINVAKYTSLPRSVFNYDKYYEKLNDREVLMFKASKLSKAMRRQVRYYYKFDFDLRFAITDLNLRRKRNDHQLRSSISKVENSMSKSFVSIQSNFST